MNIVILSYLTILIEVSLNIAVYPLCSKYRLGASCRQPAVLGEVQSLSTFKSPQSRGEGPRSIDL